MMNSLARRAALAAALAAPLLAPAALRAQAEESVPTTELTMMTGQRVHVPQGALLGFAPNSATRMVARVTSATGLKPNFAVVATEDRAIENAAAAVDAKSGKRYVLFNPNWMDRLVAGAGGSEWASLSVLAHEVGHHLNGHTLQGTTTKEVELEADEFAGFILGRLGAPESAVTAAIRATSVAEETMTHPGRASREASALAGWRRAGGGTAVAATPTPTPVTPTPTTPTTPAGMTKLELSEPQAVHVGASYPTEFRREHWRRDRLVTSLTSSGERWMMVLSAVDSMKGTAQTAFTLAPDSARTTIRSYWEKGYKITSFVPTGTLWALIMTKTNIGAQSYFPPSDSMPAAWIREKWNEQRRITSLNRNDGKWTVVMANGTGYGEQGWDTRVGEDSIKVAIKKRWDDGFSITDIACGGNVYGIVASKGGPLQSQQWATRKTLEDLQTYLGKAWGEGRRVVKLADCGDKFWILTSQGTGYN